MTLVPSKSLRNSFLWAVLSLWLAACSGPAPLPDFRYYRLSPATKVEQLASPVLDAPLVVNAVQADGVHGERPILYSTDPNSLRISQYHYQVWNDPPPSMLQRRAMNLFDAYAMAPLVTDRLDPRIAAFRLSMRLTRFEIIRSGGSNREVVVSVRMRVDRDGVRLPLMDQPYTERLEADGERLEQGTQKLSEAVDKILLRFANDLGGKVAAMRDKAD